MSVAGEVSVTGEVSGAVSVSTAGALSGAPLSTWATVSAGVAVSLDGAFVVLWSQAVRLARTKIPIMRCTFETPVSQTIA